jgi:hypothetical protein
MPQICDMGQTALLPLPKEGMLSIISPEKIKIKELIGLNYLIN